jgi:putative transposase
VVVQGCQRDRLERVCRYALRPPLAQERLHQTSEGEIWLTLRHRWADGTTHLRFDPLELLERLAVLTPRPRVNLILYYGVLAPRAARRAALVPGTSQGINISHGESSVEGDQDTNRTGPSRPGAYQWAELMRRTFGLDVLACPRCGGRLRLVALIEQAAVVQRILRHLGLPGRYPSRGRHGRCPGDSRHSRINPKTLLNSMPPGESIASRQVSARRVASCSLTVISLGLPADLALIRFQTAGLSALS